MRLLLRSALAGRRLLSPNGWFTIGTAVMVFTIELAGRRTATDLHDALAASLLGLVALFVVLRHRQQALAWVGVLQGGYGRAAETVRGLAFDIGIDLRGRPPVPRGYPPAVLFGGLLLIGWAALLVALGDHFPHGLRWFGVNGWYVGYLLLLAGLWAALVFGILLAFFIPIALIHDRFVGGFDGDGERSRQLELVAVAGYFAALFLVAYVVPIWGLLALCGLALAANLMTVVLPANPDVQFLWRPRGGGAVRSIPWGRWVTCEFALITVALFDLVLTACGGRVFAGSSAGREAMPLTTTLGTLLAWLAPGVLLALVAQTILGRARDPARPSRPALAVGGALRDHHRQTIRQLFSARGWAVRFADQAADPEAVRVELVPPDQSQAAEFDPDWPLRVSLDDLERGAVVDRLERRDEIQKRRRIVGALERLFKRAARKRYQNGSGFWVAPHYWFITGLTRDAQEEELDLHDGAVLSGTIGAPYHRALSRPARHYLYRLLRALQVDLIFVEDGVSFRRFVRVLRKLFELYDKNGGRKRAEEAQFTGLPGTRVLIHEFRLDEPFKSDTYPEPKYDYLGRARILHVFRDRGEQDEPLETPVDFTSSPAPAAVG